MKNVVFDRVELTGGYLFGKHVLNRKITVGAVYDRFKESGRIAAFDFRYCEGISDPSEKPHIFWDSDVAKWMESAAYVLKEAPDAELEAKVDSLVERIRAYQCADGYFNIYYTVVEPHNRFADRTKHELYCAGHLIEAAIAYHQATGKRTFLDCMEKYVACIRRVFLIQKSAPFASSGHEEIEIALIRLYLHTGDRAHLELAEHFLNVRGTEADQPQDSYNQSHKPVREQDEALGHSVRAMYLYASMAMLAHETGDEALISACKKLWEDTTERKMYVTGGVGSTRIGESFTVPFDLPSDQAYTETCAGIGLIFYAAAMLQLENDAKYADVIERVLYNGLLSGLSLDGEKFFYENPLEINLGDRFSSSYGKRVFPRTQRLKSFSCSCCPPNITRLLATLGNYVYGLDSDTLYVNQFIPSKMNSDGVHCALTSDYPNGGRITVNASGISSVAIRIPAWCEKFTCNKPYVLKNGYAMIENNGEITLELDLTPHAVFADCRSYNNASRLCVMRGPVVYCAEAVDNSENLHAYVLPARLQAAERFSEEIGLYALDVRCRRRLPFQVGLYSNRPAETVEDTLHMIPYSAFANRGECNMIVWLCMSE